MRDIRRDLAILKEALEEANEELNDPKILEEIDDLELAQQSVVLIEHAVDL